MYNCRSFGNGLKEDNTYVLFKMWYRCTGRIQIL